jgi:hypothetical protein
MALPAAAAVAVKAGLLRKLGPFVLGGLAVLIMVPVLGLLSVVSFFGDAERQQAMSCTVGVAAPNAQAGEIPAALLEVYMGAGQRYGVDWRLLAGIGSVETDHGRNLAVSSAGALGWMQFMPGTWATYGVDGDGDGKKDPWTMADAVYGAANYIKALLAQENGDVRGAIFGYNHATWYVDQVIAAAKNYGYGSPDTQTTSPQAALGRFDSDQAAQVAQARRGRVAFAIADGDGKIVSAFRPNQQFHSASITKAMLLVAALRDHAGEALPDGLSADLAPMIRQSDNAAANAVYARVGSAGVNAVAAAAGMRNFELDTGDPLYRLGDSLITAADQARLFSQILTLIPAGHRDYAKSLLTSVDATWGIVEAAGAGDVLSKAGWRLEGQDGDGWTIVQGAQVPTGAGAIGIAVLSDTQPSESYGHDSVKRVASSLLTSAGIDTTAPGAAGCDGIGGGGPQVLRQAADELEAMHIGYVYGGGHASTPAEPDPGLDCSSSVSWVLQKAGYDVPTLATPGFIEWADPGRGEDGVTLWNKPYGNDAHIIIQIGDRFFGTSGFGHPSKGIGPAWFDTAPSAGYLAGFQPTHIPASAVPDDASPDAGDDFSDDTPDDADAIGAGVGVYAN